MKTVTATVVYPVQVTVEVADDATVEQIEAAVLDKAEDYMQGSFSIEPAIHECSEPGIVDDEDENHQDGVKIDAYDAEALAEDEEGA